MKPILVITSFLLCMQAAAQTATEKTKIETGFKKIVAEYLINFKNILGPKKDATTEGEIIYYSKEKLYGTIDSTNLIYYNTDQKTWRFKAEIDQATTMYASNKEALATIVSKLVFSFGKLKGIASGVEWLSDYIPANKNGATQKIKQLCISFWRGYQHNKEDKEVSVRIGADPYYADK